MSVNSQAPQSDTPAVGVRIGDIEGGIHDTTIAGRDVIHRTINIYAGGPDARNPQDRRAMLKQVKDFWIEGVLLRTREGMGFLDLELTTRSSSIQRPLRDLAPGTDYPEQQQPPGTRFIDVLDKTGGALLILGEPGAGKTTMLLELASDAIRRAENDPNPNDSSEPIPVILNLSSWGIMQQAFDEWLVDELNSKYTVPRIVARKWIDNKELLLLLDGLDEVRAEKRDACVQAINDFRSNHGSMSLVICSRVADYDLLQTKINANGALIIHPLNTSQVEEYLTNAGPKLEALRVALSSDPAMMELAHSPLMLNILTTTYTDQNAVDRGQSNSIEVRRSQVLHAYVQKMFNRRRPNPRYPQNCTIQRLAWLAQQMSRHSESVLIVERLQPTWLRTERHRHQYAVLSRILAGCVTGGFIGLVLACLTFVVFWPFPLAAGGLVALFGAIVVAMFIGAFVTAVGGLIGLVVGLVHSRTAVTERIDVVENLAWSWRELSIELRRRWRTALQGLPMPGGLSDPSIWYWRTVITLIRALPAGLHGIVVSDKVALRQMLAQTAACSVLGTLIGIAYGVASGVFLALLQLIIDLFQMVLSSIWSFILVGSFSLVETAQVPDLLQEFLAVSLVLGSALGLLLGVRSGLRLGGFSLAQHLSLRVVLWYTGVTPWNLKQFLEHATQLTFMRRVGNGYIFAHGLVQDHFARMAEEAQ